MIIRNATLPPECRTYAPEPPRHRVETAAYAICNALAEDRSPTRSENERRVDLYAACAGFPRWGTRERNSQNEYRWAVRRMIEESLLEVIEEQYEPPQADPGDLFVRPEPERPPEWYLQSMPKLWAKWQAALPIIDGSQTTLGLLRGGQDIPNQSGLRERCSIEINQHAPQKRKNIGARMMALLHTNPPCMFWSASQFAEHLGCATSVVKESKTWRHIMMARALQKAERIAPTGVLNGGNRKRQ